jgi:pyrroloquinoline quinone biosynthesis protein D
MLKVSTHSIPELTEGARVCWEDDEQAFVLLYPEGMIVLDSPTSNLLQHCNGVQTIEEIFTQMKSSEPTPFNRHHVLQNIDQVVNIGLLRFR